MIFHLCEKQDWEKAREAGEYEAASLKKEGFIHLSTYGQILSIANWWYKKSSEPILLMLDNNKISEHLKWEGEDCLDFPHLYRPIKVNEVLKTIPLNRVSDQFVDSEELQLAAEAITLSTERLSLREFQLSDFDTVHEYASDENLLKYMIWGPNTKLDTRAFFSRVFKWQSENPREEYHFAVVENKSKTLVGGCNLSIDDIETGVGSIGYILNPKFHKLGYATELSRELLRFGFKKLYLNRIDATCDKLNEPSFNVMKRIGMRQTDLILNDKINGRIRNTVVCSIAKLSPQ